MSWDEASSHAARGAGRRCGARPVRRGQPGLGARFEAALDGTFARLVAHPLGYPMVHRKARRAGVGGAFAAYLVFYRIEADDLVVLAVIHGSRHPRHWKRRV